VVQSNNDWLGGYAKWLTDHPATNGYPKTVIFHADDWMTVVDMGPRGGRRKLGGNDEVHRGVGEIMTTPAFTSVAYTDEYHAELVVAELKRRDCRAVGIAGGGAMPHKFVTRIEQEMAPHATLGRHDRGARLARRRSRARRRSPPSARRRRCRTKSSPVSPQ
jgi:hypothetical protein